MNIDESIESQGDILKRLLGSEQQPLVNIATNPPPCAQVPGVYIILHPSIDSTVYAGKTNDQNHLCRRMQDHRNGNDNSDLPVKLRRHPDLPQDVSSYQVKMIEIADPRERYFFEQFAVGVLKPKLNG